MEELDVRPTQELRSIVDGEADRVRVVAGARSLWVQSLLHLPRIADERGFAPSGDVRREIRRLARRMNEDSAGLTKYLAAPAKPPRSPRELAARAASADEAHVLLERFHYLRSPRNDARHAVAALGDRIAAIASLSTLDLPHIAAELDVAAEAVGVISRVFAFDWSPRNTISWLLARTPPLLDHERRLKLLITYVNPNLDFNGASYRAANWTRVGFEHGTSYAYLDRDYITDRALQQRYGTADRHYLRALLGSRIEFSRMRLRPLEVYAIALGGTKQITGFDVERVVA